ncbi:MAG: DUF58 domain-containing protein [Pseudomonadota bacterium]
MNDTTPLSPELLAQMKRIQFRMRSLVSELFAGEYQSAFKGRGMEFEEVRLYNPGDDVRAIDWNVTARTGVPHIKLFREERELTIMFIVDVSASMRFGTRRRFKSEVAAEVAALLAYTALRNNDKTGLIIFSDKVEHYVPPKKGHGHIWRVIRDILSYKSTAVETDLSLPLDYLNRVAKRRLVAFLISDFQGEGYDKLLKRTAKHHDLIAVNVTDPHEREMPDVGLIELRDMEGGDQMLIDTGLEGTRAIWRAEVRMEKKRREYLFRMAGVEFINVETGGSVIDPIIRFFRQREKRG